MMWRSLLLFLRPLLLYSSIHIFPASLFWLFTLFGRNFGEILKLRGLIPNYIFMFSVYVCLSISLVVSHCCYGLILCSLLVMCFFSCIICYVCTAFYISRLPLRYTICRLAILYNFTLLLHFYFSYYCIIT